MGQLEAKLFAATIKALIGSCAAHSKENRRIFNPDRHVIFHRSAFLQCVSVRMNTRNSIEDLIPGPDTELIHPNQCHEEGPFFKLDRCPV